LGFYTKVIRPILFSGLRADPEWLHNEAMAILTGLEQSFDQPWSQWLQKQLQQAYGYSDPRLEQQLWDLQFPNPLGLAAGFDKNGAAAGVWASFGFGFAELGTVTLQPQPGNPRPRLFRLLEDEAVLNRMGFNNQGAAQVQAQLQSRWQGQAPPIPLGINLGKSKVTPLEDAVSDYVGSFKLLQEWGSYFVVNVSSPNTPGLRSLQAAASLEPILAALQQANTSHQPLLIKIAPDLEWQEIATIIELAQRYQLAGIIATNTTIARAGLKTQVIAATGQPVEVEAGGISGAPLRQRATEVIRFIWKETQGQLPIIGVGGIFTAADAWEKITAGATLVQVYTGWIYEGPGMVRQVLQGLLKRLEQQGMGHISEAIGSAHR